MRGQQLLVRGQLHSPMGKLVMRVAHVAPIRARCFNSKRTSFHVALELEHVGSVDLRSAIRKADAVLPAFAREGQRGHTVKRVARRGRCRLLFLLGVQHISKPVNLRTWRLVSDPIAMVQALAELRYGVVAYTRAKQCEIWAQLRPHPLLYTSSPQARLRMFPCPGPRARLAGFSLIT